MLLSVHLQHKGSPLSDCLSGIAENRATLSIQDYTTLFLPYTLCSVEAKLSGGMMLVLPGRGYLRIETRPLGRGIEARVEKKCGLLCLTLGNVRPHTNIKLMIKAEEQYLPQPDKNKVLIVARDCQLCLRRVSEYSQLLRYKGIRWIERILRLRDYRDYRKMKQKQKSCSIF